MVECKKFINIRDRARLELIKSILGEIVSSTRCDNTEKVASLVESAKVKVDMAIDEINVNLEES